jgi:hypothetical protein
MSRSSAEADHWHHAMCEAQLGFFRAILKVDTDESWWEDGARDTAHWLVMRYGLSYWKAYRWIEAVRALESLPEISRALGSGVLGADKVVELARSPRRRRKPGSSLGPKALRVPRSVTVGMN